MMCWYNKKSFAFENGDFDRDWGKHDNGNQNNQNLTPGLSVHEPTNRRIGRIHDWMIVIMYSR